MKVCLTANDAQFILPTTLTAGGNLRSVKSSEHQKNDRYFPFIRQMSLPVSEHLAYTIQSTTQRVWRILFDQKSKTKQLRN